MIRTLLRRLIDGVADGVADGATDGATDGRQVRLRVVFSDASIYDSSRHGAPDITIVFHKRALLPGQATGSVGQDLESEIIDRCRNDFMRGHFARLGRSLPVEPWSPAPALSGAAAFSESAAASALTGSVVASALAASAAAPAMSGSSGSATLAAMTAAAATPPLDRGAPGLSS
jgi:hypothetical protein